MKIHSLIFKVIITFGVVLSIFSVNAMAQKYYEYPSDIIYRGKAAKLHFSQADGSSMFRTRITQDIKAGINFGGEYSVVEIGCGSSCMNAFVVNLKTGTIIRFPLGGEPNYQMQLNYSVKSRLIKAIWHDIEANDNDACNIEFWAIKNDRFKKINSYTKALKDNYCYIYMD